eukprot:COSAG03_NODE_8_length_24035_cov_36.331885_13_plen_61_part_00
MMARVGKEDKDGNRMVAVPPVDGDLQPPAENVAALVAHSFATLRRVRNQRLFANRASTRV